MRPRFRTSSTILVALVLLVVVGLRLVPASSLSDRIQVAVEVTNVVLAFSILLYAVGWAVGGLFLPLEWKQYEMLLAPLVGAVLLVPASYLLNYFVDMKTATGVIVLVVLPFAFWRSRHGPRLTVSSELRLPAIAAAALLGLALLPHLVQGALGLLALSYDDETYFYLAQYLLAYPAGAGMPGPPSPILNQNSDFMRAEGWGYQYLLSLGSAASGVTPYDAYLPTAYVLLALSVPAWYLFFRQVLQMRPERARLATILYALLGLALWFASYGYARQTAWIALTPVVLSALALVIRRSGIRHLITCGLFVGSMVAIEARVGLTHMALVAIGLAFYWLALDRKLSSAVRLAGSAAIAVVASAPTLWHFTRFYLLGGGSDLLNSGNAANWNPNFGQFPSPAMMLGLEPNVYARITEPIEVLSWLDPLDRGMSLLAPYLAWVLLAIAISALVQSVRRNPLAVSLVAGLLLWLIALRTALPFPYGYFKLSGVAAPLVIGFLMAESPLSLLASRFSQLAARFSLLASRLSALDSWLSPLAARCSLTSLGLLAVAILALFFARNTGNSFLFGARGWSLSVPPSLVRSVSAFAEIAGPDSRIFVTGATRYPIPEGPVILRKTHTLGMQSREEVAIERAKKMRALVVTSLVGRQLYGVFKTELWPWSRLLLDERYDYYVLDGDEEPRLYGLDPGDAVATAEGMVLYRAPGDARAGAGRILQERGNLEVAQGNPAIVLAEPGRVSFQTGQAPSGAQGTGRVRLQFMALSTTVVDVLADGFQRRLAIDPGVAWYTTASLRLPTRVRIETASDQPVRLIAVRELPEGREELDRSNDTAASVEVGADGDGVVVDLWFANPMRDGPGASAFIGVADAPYPERKLGLSMPDPGRRWTLRFPLAGGGPVQLRDGLEEVPMEGLPWLENGGGVMSLRLRTGRDPVHDYPLAVASRDRDGSMRVDGYADPIEIRMWNWKDRVEEKKGLDPASLEGTVVSSGDGFRYLVQGGRRHWIADPAVAEALGSPRLLTPEQLWIIPPGLPLEK